MVTKLDPAVIERSVHATFSSGLDAGQLEPWLQWSYRLKFIDRPVRAADLVEPA